MASLTGCTPLICLVAIVYSVLSVSHTIDPWLTNVNAPTTTSNSLDVTDMPCRGCALQKEFSEAALSLEELRRVKIEYIKFQILQKLRLKAPPQPKMPKSILPSLITDGDLLTPTDEDIVATVPYGEEFYGLTQQVVIFPDNSSYTCDRGRNSTCLKFRLTRDITTKNVSASELFIYFSTDASEENTNHTFAAFEVISDPVHKAVRKRVIKFLEISEQYGWLKFDVGNMISRWSSRRRTLHTVEISCLDCQYESLVTSDDDKRPFLIVHTDSTNFVDRKRRNVECTESNDRCCRESFYLSFKDIGWNDWILQPPGYQANYCRGSCLSDVSISRYHHTTVVQRYLQSQSSGEHNMSLSLCCTPSRMSSISLIYVDDNNYIFKKSLPNMVVESCDCA